jgi:hypothetical protein
VALASAWEGSCYDHHSSCAAATQDSTLPTRVINVLNLGGAVLEDGGCRRDEYLTLSYKWGGAKRYLTLTDIIACHYDTIPHEELPKTFQDAIYVTQQLGFKYLWIDALCIVHDRHENLQREISHMGDIYRGASLTLFAEVGDSAEHGLSTHTMYTIPGLRHLGNHNLAIFGSEFTHGSLDEPAYPHASMTALMLVGYCTTGKVDLDRSIEKTHSTIDIYDGVSGVSFDGGYKHLVVTPETKEIIGLAIFDLDMDTESIEEIICCFCTIYTGRPGYEDFPGITCLVLVATQWPGEYRRAGFLGWKFPEELHHIADLLQLIEHLPPWFRTGPQQTITLI